MQRLLEGFHRWLDQAGTNHALSGILGCHCSVNDWKNSSLYNFPYVNPVAVPSKFSAGIVYPLFFAMVISCICLLYLSASSGVPPTKLMIAGAAAKVKPPSPAVSVIALSPMSGLASSAVNPGKV